MAVSSDDDYLPLRDCPIPVNRKPLLALPSTTQYDFFLHMALKHLQFSNTYKL